MQRNEIVTLIKNLFNQVWGKLQEQAIAEYYDQSVKGYIGNQPINYQDIVNRQRYIKNNYLSIQNDIDDVIIENDRVVVRINQTYVDKNNREENFKIIAIYKFHDKKITAMWACINPDINYFQSEQHK